MTDFWVHSTAHSDQRIIAAGNTAVGLWLRAGAWCAEHADDEQLRVPPELLRHLAANRRTADRLVAARLWEPLGRGWAFLPVLWSLESRRRRDAIPLQLRWRVLARDHHACRHCGATGDLQMDHVYPWMLGGPTTFENLQTLCGPCNRAKGARVDA